MRGGRQTVNITVKLAARTATCRACTCYRVILPVSHAVTNTTLDILNLSLSYLYIYQLHVDHEEMELEAG